MQLLGLFNCASSYLVVAAFLFACGVYGMMCRRTLIGILISAELILAAASLNFMAFSRFFAPDPVSGRLFTLFIMAIAAAEAAIAVSILIAVYRNYKSIESEDLTDLRG